MHAAQQPYRDLFDALLRHEQDALFSDVIAPWLASASAEKRWLHAIAQHASPEHDLPHEDSWRLYALSRIIDLLAIATIGSQPPHRSVAPLTIEDFARAMDDLGLERIRAPSFHPFFHEIHAVEQTQDPATPPQISAEILPGYRIGKLLVCRARCRVVAGRDHIAKEIAENSVMYWAFVRSARPTADLSMGWGSNSQWRTAFRLDYEVDGTYYFNHGAQRMPPDDEDALDPVEKLEMLRHRCFVRCTKDGADLWPYGWRAVESPGEALRLTH